MQPSPLKKSFGGLFNKNNKLKQKLITLNSSNNLLLNKEVDSEKQRLLDDYKNHLKKNKQGTQSMLVSEDNKSHTLLMSNHPDSTTTANEHEGVR